MNKKPQASLESLFHSQPEVAAKLLNKKLAEGSLHEFVKQAWSSMETNPFQDNWHIQNLCEVLEDVTRGHIRFLLVNLPPRCGKTDLVNICWPIWTWLQPENTVTSGSGVRFLCASYGDKLTLENADKMRDLMMSKWFQSVWGDKIKLKSDKNTKSAYAIEEGGSRYSTSIAGTLLGLGGDVIVVDDPHNTESVESDAERETTLRGWRELSSTRLNDPQRSAIVVVMQRLHESDVSGVIIDGDDYEKWTHLMYPMRHDPMRHCSSDPRQGDDLMWPRRFGENEVKKMEINLGPYMSSGRLQQSPTPDGGGIIKRDWWKVWPPEDWPEHPDGRVRFPANMEYIIAICDTAYTDKQENDPSACVVLGVFAVHGIPKIILMGAWTDYLEFNALLEKIIITCRNPKRKCDALLVEGKASGKSIIQEVKRKCRPEEFSVYELKPDGDKVSRAHAVVPMFAAGCVYAPDFAWADMVIDQCVQFPKGKHDDLVDCVVYGISYLRKSGIALLPEEGSRIIEDGMMYENIVDNERLYDV